MELPVKMFRDADAWESWLSQHHDSSGIWMKFAKKDSGRQTVNYSDALDVALCWGWIDGQKAAFDDKFYLLRFTPRTKRSKWSQLNIERVVALEKSRRMQ